MLTYSYSAPIKRRAKALAVFYKQIISVVLFDVDRLKSAFACNSKLSPAAMSCNNRLAIAGAADLVGSKFGFAIIPSKRCLIVSPITYLAELLAWSKSVSVFNASIVYVASVSAKSKSKSLTNTSKPSLLSLSPNFSKANERPINPNYPSGLRFLLLTQPAN